MPQIVEIGKREFEDQSLHFYSNIDECLAHDSIDGILFGSALQYLPDPYDVLNSLGKYKFDYLIMRQNAVFPTVAVTEYVFSMFPKYL